MTTMAPSVLDDFAPGDLAELRRIAGELRAVMDMNAATHVSYPGGVQASASIAPGAPGSAGPGSDMSMASALLYVVAGAAVLTWGTAYIGRRGVKPQFGRFDVPSIIFNGAGTIMLIATLKTLAYRYHGHKVAQALLLLV